MSSLLLLLSFRHRKISINTLIPLGKNIRAEQYSKNGIHQFCF